MPPCAHRVEPAASTSLVTTRTRSPSPSRAMRRAVVRPAMPEPTTTTSASTIQPGAGPAAAAAGSIRRCTESAMLSMSRGRADQRGHQQPGRAGGGGRRRGRARAARGSPRCRPASSAAGRGQHGRVPAGPPRRRRPAARATAPAPAARSSADRKTLRLDSASPSGSRTVGDADEPTPAGPGRRPAGGPGSAAGSPSRRRTRRPGAQVNSFVTTVSTPSKCPGRFGPSSWLASAPAVTQTCAGPDA